MKNETVQPSATEQAIAKIEFTDAKAFESIVAAINGLADKYRGLQITDTASYKVVVSGIAEMRTLRVAVEKRRKELKTDAISKIDGPAKIIAEKLLPIENDLKNLKQATDDKKALVKAEKDRLERERIESIQSKIDAFPPDITRLPQLLKMTAPEIREMQDALASVEIDIEVYQEFTPDAIKAKTDKIKLLQEYYIARIQTTAEEKKQQAETERQQQAKKEQELEIERQKAQLAKIQKEQEAEAQKLCDAQAKIEAQKKAIQDEKDHLKNERLERERIEQERLAKIEADRMAKIEAEKQEQVRIEKKAKEKIAREKAETEEKKRQEVLRPDKENLGIYLASLETNFNAIGAPLVKTHEGKVILEHIQYDLNVVIINGKAWLKNI